MTMEPDYLDDEEEFENVEEAAVPVSADHPMCPRCGWSNTRLSHTRSALDTVLAVISVHTFRCRSCNRRFRKFQRRE
jgi:transposase-like protein